MAKTKAQRERQDEEQARKRYVDQPGQWRDVTPKAVKTRQEKAWKEFVAFMEKGKKK